MGSQLFRSYFCGLAALLLILMPSDFSYAASNGHISLNAFVNAIIDPEQNSPSADDVLNDLKQKFNGDDLDPQEWRRMGDLVEYILFLDSRVAFFQKNNAMLFAFIQNATSINTDVAVQMKRLSDDADHVFSMPASDSSLTRYLTQDFSEAHDQLRSLEAVLVLRLKKMQVINDELRSLKIEVVSSKRRQDDAQKQEGYRDRLKEMRIALEAKETVVSKQEQDIQDLKTQFDQVCLGLEVFRQRLQETNQKMDVLVNNAASTSLDLYEKQQEVADKGELAQKLDSGLKETQERLRLVQRIIQEKDDHIQQLEQEIIDIQNRINDGTQNSKEISALRAEMNGMIKELRIEIALGHKKIDRLEGRFQEVVLANAQLESEMLKKEFLVTLLEKKVDQKDGMIADLENGFRDRAQRLSEMRGALKIYQLKLQDYMGLLEEKDREIRQYKEGDSFSDVRLDIPDSIIFSSKDIQISSRDALSEIHSQKEK